MISNKDEVLQALARIENKVNGLDGKVDEIKRVASKSGATAGAVAGGITGGIVATGIALLKAKFGIF